MSERDEQNAMRNALQRRLHDSHESSHNLRETITRLERELAAVTAERAKLRGIIYRATCDRLNGENVGSMLTEEDIAASLEVFYAMQRDLK